MSTDRSQDTQPGHATGDVARAVLRHTPAGTSEVAAYLGLSRQGAEYHLHRLEERGAIWTKKVGPTRVWVHPEIMPEP